MSITPFGIAGPGGPYEALVKQNAALSYYWPMSPVALSNGTSECLDSGPSASTLSDVISGSTYVSQAAGLPNSSNLASAVSSGGTYFAAPGTATLYLASQDISLEFWYYIPSGFSPIVPMTYICWPNIAFGIDSSYNPCVMAMMSIGGAAFAVALQTSTAAAAPVGAWHHAMLSLDSTATNWTIMRDGVTIDSFTATFSGGDYQNVVIGGQWQANGLLMNELNGSYVAHVATYSAAQPVAVAQAHYRSGLELAGKGVVLGPPGVQHGKMYFGPEGHRQTRLGRPQIDGGRRAGNPLSGMLIRRGTLGR